MAKDLRFSVSYAVLSLVTRITVATWLFLSCKDEFSCESCRAGNINRSPVANAGLDQVISLPTDSVVADGSASFDPDGRIANYLWKKIAGPTSFNIIRPSDSITKIKTLAVGSYRFELTVTDDGGLSARDTLSVIVDSVVTTNHPPKANAGADQTINLPTNSVFLDGSASTDPENNITSYSWTKISGPPAAFDNANAVQATVTHLEQGSYYFELTVTDAGGLFSKDTTKVTVNDPFISSCDISNRPLVSAQLIPIGVFSMERRFITIAAAGTKVLFAGGSDVDFGAFEFTRVDIYDTVTHSGLQRH